MEDFKFETFSNSNEEGDKCPSKIFAEALEEFCNILYNKTMIIFTSDVKKSADSPGFLPSYLHFIIFILICSSIYDVEHKIC